MVSQDRSQEKYNEIYYKLPPQTLSLLCSWKFHVRSCWQKAFAVVFVRGALCSNETTVSVCDSKYKPSSHRDPMAMCGAGADTVGCLERESVLNGRFVIKMYPGQAGRASQLRF